jgi:hypothetical protein
MLTLPAELTRRYETLLKHRGGEIGDGPRFMQARGPSCRVPAPRVSMWTPTAGPTSPHQQQT